MRKTSSKNTYMNSVDRINQILDVSCRLFSEKSYDAVSVREIADNCGCSAALIMKNFKSKELIYAALLEEWEKKCKEPIIKEIPDGDAVTALRIVFDKMTKVKAHKEYSFRHNLENAVASRISYQNTIAEIRNNLQDITNEIILPLIIRGQDENVFKQGDPNELANLFWSAMYGIRLINTNFSSFEHIDFDYIKELILS